MVCSLIYVDTVKDNFPCLPPDFKTCLQPQAVEQLAFMIDRMQGTSNENIFRWMINHRTNTTALPVIQAFWTAAQSRPSITMGDIWSVPEQDSWLYNMSINPEEGGGTRMIDASVCCVFVCKMLKAGGVFSEIESMLNCGEQALWDLFSLGIYDAASTGENRPAACKAADPTLPLCQIAGELTNFAKPDWNTRALYKWMGNNCTSLTPNYIRNPGC